MPRLILVFAGRALISLVLSCSVSNAIHQGDPVFSLHFSLPLLYLQLRTAILGPHRIVFNRKMSRLVKNQHNDCAPSEDSDQPGHPPSLIRFFAVRMKKVWVLSYPLSAQRRLWPDWADAEADLSLRWAHRHFVGFVMRWLKYKWKWEFGINIYMQ